MSNLETKKQSILALTPEDLLTRILTIRTKRRNSIITRAKAHQTKKPKSKPKAKASPAKLVDKLSAKEIQELLTSLQANND